MIYGKESDDMTNKIGMKILNIFVIFGILLINLVIPSNIFALENGDIKDSEISIGKYENDGDILVTKTVEKTDKNKEYKVTFDIKGKQVKSEVESKKNSYTVFVLDASLSMAGTKWNKAREAAINFSKTLVNDSTKNYLALVTFNGTGYQLREFKNEKFNSDSFGSIYYYTNYYEGLSKAYNYINSVNDSDAIYNIVFISDGEPNNENYSDILKTIKDNNINIYSLAYELDSNSAAYNKLLNISTNNKVYEVSSDDIDEKLFTIAKEIIKSNAGHDAVITDIIGDNFNYVSGDVIVNGKKVNINVGDIKEDNKSYSFIIKLDDDLDTNWYPTNSGYTLTYKDSNNEEQSLSTNKSALVYWISDKVNLTINYYNDNNIFKTVTKEVKKNTYIDNNYLDIDINKDNGYKLDSISNVDFDITNDTTIDIKYNKINNLKYNVNYYKDNELFNTVEYNNIIYGSIPYYDEENINGYSICLVTNNTNPVVDNDIIINVYYCKNNYNYQVNYYYDNILDSTNNYKAEYNETIDEYNTKEKEGYIIDYIDNLPLNISNNELDNIINVYYKLKDIKYTINYLDKNNNKISESKEQIGKYNDNITEKYKDIKNYKLVSDDKVNIILNDNITDINFYYELKSGNVVIKYIDEDNNEISDDTIITGNYGDNYSVSIKEIEGYHYIDNTNYIEGIINNDNLIITLKYRKDNLKDVMAPLTGISNKYIYLFIISIIGIISLIGIKLYYKFRK